MSQDPAVVDWDAVFRQAWGEPILPRPPWRPDNRTPFEVARDDALEDVAEARADHNTYDCEARADEAADRYERHLERGWE